MIIFISVSSIIVEGKNTVRLGQETEKYFLVKEYSWLLNPVSIILTFKVSQLYLDIKQCKETQSSSARAHLQYLIYMSTCAECLNGKPALCPRFSHDFYFWIYFLPQKYLSEFTFDGIFTASPPWDNSLFTNIWLCSCSNY